MLFVGDLPRGLYPTDRNNFGPRFGFAYDVTGNGRFAIRGAWGLFYDTVNADSVALENPPFAGSARFFNGRLSNPLAGQTPPPVVPDAENFQFVYPVNLFFHDLGIRSPMMFCLLQTCRAARSRPTGGRTEPQKGFAFARFPYLSESPERPGAVKGARILRGEANP
jgi:hypothetical protein